MNLSGSESEFEFPFGSESEQPIRAVFGTQETYHMRHWAPIRCRRAMDPAPRHQHKSKQYSELKQLTTCATGRQSDEDAERQILRPKNRSIDAYEPPI